VEAKTPNVAKTDGRAWCTEVRQWAAFVDSSFLIF
jgi:hypothetical protein